MGTAWGSLSELHDFLERLFESKERFSSPTDFVGTVHNAMAGQAAMWLGARGANVTTSSGYTSFADALLMTNLISPAGMLGGNVLVMGADEAHVTLTQRLDPPPAGVQLSDGGGALILGPAIPGDRCPMVRVAFHGGGVESGVVEKLVRSLGGVEMARSRIGALWIGAQAREGRLGLAQRAELSATFGDDLEIVDFHDLLGHYATSSAAATALAAAMLLRDGPARFDNKGVAIVGLGKRVTAIELIPEG